MTFETDKALLKASADEALAQAVVFLDDLKTAAGTSISSIPFNIDSALPLGYTYEYFNPSAPEPVITLPEFDSAPTIDATLGAFPDRPTYVFSDVDNITPPDFTAVATAVAIPSSPSNTLPTAPGAAPSFVSPDIPAAPVVTLPTVPVFEAFALPTPPSINLPSFSAITPNDDLLAPTTQFQYAEAAYESTLLDPLKAKLLYDLQNGGYGIETADEIALFNREREREIEAALTRIEEAGRSMASRGFPLPPGELSIHVDRAWQDMQNKVSGVSRDIALKRADMFVENRKFTLEQIKGVEQVLIGFHSAVQERALNVAKATVEMSIAIFDALVKRYVARLDGYKTAAMVFEAQTRAELAKAEIYRTEIEAAGLSVQMQRQLVERYIAQIRGVELSVSIYRTQMEAAAIHAGIERTKLDAFRAQVEAYTAQVGAKVAEFGLFRAQIEGEKAKVDVFDSQVRAYNGQVAGLKAKADVQISRLQSEAESVRAKVALYQGQIAGYESDARTRLDSGRLKTEIYRTGVEATKAEVQATIAQADSNIRSFEVQVRSDLETERIVIENARTKLDAAINSIKFKIAAAEFGSRNVFAQLTALSSSANTLAVQTTEG